MKLFGINTVCMHPETRVTRCVGPQRDGFAMQPSCCEAMSSAKLGQVCDDPGRFGEYSKACPSHGGRVISSNLVSVRSELIVEALDDYSGS